MIPHDVRLYTWLDVEEVLLTCRTKGEWPEWLVRAQAYWDGLVLGIRPGKREEALSWLHQIYDPRFDGRDESIILESAPGYRRALKVILEETDEEPWQPGFVPTFSRPTVLWPPTKLVSPSKIEPDLPPVVAFHSFKGGVGRTLHAIALARALVHDNQRKGQVLLVDADLEAPGISWMLRKRLPDPPVSFADFLALVHGDADPKARESIRLVGDRLRNVLLDGIYVLPAFRSDKYFSSLEIRPENLIKGAEDPYRLTTLLAELGKTLGAKAVIVDLRAGLSELSAGLLLDPRVYRVLVTTLSGQSVSGTRLVLDLLARMAPSTEEEHPLPAFIISQVSEEHQERGTVADVEQELLESARPFLSDDREPPRVITVFDSRLSVLPSNWEDVMSRLEKATLIEALLPLTYWLPGDKVTESGPEGLSRLPERRKNLSKFAGSLVYAETGECQEFLAIQPLRNLASDHRQKIPIAVVVGAKGAGKTYTFLQVVRRKLWGEFAQAAGVMDVTDVESRALIYPLLSSKNLREAAEKIVQTARLETVSALGFQEAMNAIAVRDCIRDFLRSQSPLHEGDWRERWLDLMAWAVGYHVREEGAGRSLVEYLGERGQRVIVVVDGLEDTFQNFLNNESEQIALRALLQEVPEWLRQQPNPFLGLIVFIRSDMVHAAIRQNAAQLMARYEPYALKWSSEEALRLVAWIAVNSQTLSVPGNDAPWETSQEKLGELLIPLWGRKLGSDRSREARSAEWVLAALSDLLGQIQARDLVRFLSLAARRSEEDKYWTDRVLVPQALRAALPECSREKIKEISSENPTLGELFEHLRNLPVEVKQTPFTAEQVGLDRGQIRTLEDNGVILREGDEYYLPEIFRLGLDFQQKTGARPRVLSLARRARSWM